MKKLYVPLLSLILLSSCSQRLITKGIQDKTSNYIVTTEGKHVDATSVSINSGVVSTGKDIYPLTGLSAIKTGQAYYGVKNGTLYDGVYYGKLMLLRRYVGREYNMSSHSSRAVYNYYLQKEGQPEILDFDNRNLIESVRDNPLALRKARAASIFVKVNLLTAITTISGLSCVFLPYTSPVRKPAVTIGLFSLPTFLITLPIASHKRYKTIVVYNR